MLSILSLSFKSLVEIVSSCFSMLLNLTFSALIIMHSRHRPWISRDAPMELSVLAYSILQNWNWLFLRSWFIVWRSSWLWSSSCCWLQLIRANVVVISLFFDIICVHSIFDVRRLAHRIFGAMMPLGMIFVMWHFWRCDRRETVGLVHLAILGVGAWAIFQRREVLRWLELIMVEAVECWMFALVLLNLIFTFMMRVVTWLLWISRFV